MSKRILRGNDIDVAWKVSIYDEYGTKVPLTSISSLGVQLIVGENVIELTRENSNLTIVGDIISFRFFGKDQEYSGSYILKLYSTTNSALTYYTCNAFVIVNRDGEEVSPQPEIVELESSVSMNRTIIARGEKGERGEKGKDGNNGTLGSVLTIGPNGNWWINGIDTGVPATGEAGQAGAFKSIVFYRSATVPNTPVGGTYEYPIPHDPVTNEMWSDGIPNGVEMIWSSAATFYANEEHTAWSVPQMMKDTSDLDIEFALRYDLDEEDGQDVVPPAPSDEDNEFGNRHNAEPQSNQIWYDPEQDSERLGGDWSHMYWRAERKFSKGQWGVWTISRIKGEKGDQGPTGRKSATAALYKRSATKPLKPALDSSWPSDVQVIYTFKAANRTENMISTAPDGKIPSGWCMLGDVPSGSDPLWVIAAPAAADQDDPDDRIYKNEWSDPVEYGGGDGLSIGTVKLYKRSEQKPVAFTRDTEFNFETNELTYREGSTVIVLKPGPTSPIDTNIDGWKRYISDENNEWPVWETSAPAVAHGKGVDIIEEEEWTPPAKTGGDPGIDGQRTTTVQLYRRSNTELTEADRPVSPDGYVVYSFEDNALTVSSVGEWSTTIPNSIGLIWVTVATASCSAKDKFDNIYDNQWTPPVSYAGEGFNSFPLQLYQRSATQPEKPGRTLYYHFTNSHVTLDASTSTGFGPTSDDVITGGWRRVKVGGSDPLWVVEATALSYTDVDDIPVGEWSEAHELVRDGQSTFMSTLFVRMNNTPTKPGNSDGSYSNPSPHVLAGKNSDDQNVYWSDGIPAGENTIWATSRIFTNNGAAPQQASWSDPKVMSDTDTWDVEFAKKQANDAEPAKPTDANRRGGSGTQIWFDPIEDSSEDFTKMFWRAEREKRNGEYVGDWTILRIQGEKGDRGDDGRSITGVKEWFLVSSQSSGIQSPAITANPATTNPRWYESAPELTDSNPYLWCFTRWTFSKEPLVEQSNAYIVRYLNPEVELDYDEIVDNINTEIDADLRQYKTKIAAVEATKTEIENSPGFYSMLTKYKSGDQTSFADQVFNAEKSKIESSAVSAVDNKLAASSLSLDGLKGAIDAKATMQDVSEAGYVTLSTARTSWQSDDKAAIISAVSQGTYIWRKPKTISDGGKSTSSYEYKAYQIPANTTESDYETTETNAGWEKVVTAAALSTIKQEADNILLAVGNGETASAAIKLLANAGTSGSKIILTADNVDIQGGVTIGAVPEIPGSKIADNAITTTKIQGGAITTDKIAANSITAGQLHATVISDVRTAIIDEIQAGSIKANYLESSTTDGRLTTVIEPGLFNLKLNGRVVARFEVDGDGVILKFLKSDGTWCSIGSGGLSFADISATQESWDEYKVAPFTTSGDINTVQYYLNDSSTYTELPFEMPQYVTLQRYNCASKTISGQGTRYWNPDDGAQSVDSAWKTTKPWQDGKYFVSKSRNSSDLATYEYVMEYPYTSGINAILYDTSTTTSWDYAIYEFDIFSINSGVIGGNLGTLQGKLEYVGSNADQYIQQHLILSAGDTLYTSNVDISGWDNPK